MTNYDKMYNLLVENGMQSKISKLFIKKFRIDEENFVGGTDTKEWAMSRGFFPSRVELYDLNEENYKNYLPDFVDFMLHPYNNESVVWVNDKLSLKYTLGEDFADIMPDYYLYVENSGEYTYLEDAPDNIEKNNLYILNLLKMKKALIIKPNSSKSGGEGVMKVEYVDCLQYTDNQSICGGVLLNNKLLIPVEEFQQRIKNLGNNIVTEYAYQHDDLKKIWPDSECTLRIVMIKMPLSNYYSEAKWKCVSSFARFGTSISGGTSNLSAGGIGVGFDFNTGKLKPTGYRYLQFCSRNDNPNEHPDTHVLWQNEKLPNWDYVRDTLYKVCAHYGSLSHLGFDVIITQKGFVLCEINSKPETLVSQLTCTPLLLEEDNRAYYLSKGMGKVNISDFYDIYKQSQE